jgi:hypothetical protein
MSDNAGPHLAETNDAEAGLLLWVDHGAILLGHRCRIVEG